MGRPRKRPSYVIAVANELGGIGKDRTFDPESDPNESLLDELQCPVADDVLIALRKAFLEEIRKKKEQSAVTD